MGDLGIFASKFSINSKSLKEFDKALYFLRNGGEITRKPQEKEMLDKLLNVLQPVSVVIGGNLSDSTTINERGIMETLKNRHSKDWGAYKDKILSLNLKLNSETFTITQEDLGLLNDIANALDAECFNLFRRMSEK
jgi:hypothetical protein